MSKRAESPKEEASSKGKARNDNAVKKYVKRCTMLVRRCTKPDNKEYSKIARSAGIGVVLLGTVGYALKLVSIPLNNMLLS
ncbi:hypothetical protein PCE1_001005 [Barthelona sp. PCE]